MKLDSRQLDKCGRRGFLFFPGLFSAHEIVIVARQRSRSRYRKSSERRERRYPGMPPLGGHRALLASTLGTSLCMDRSRQEAFGRRIGRRYSGLCSTRRRNITSAL